MSDEIDWNAVMNAPVKESELPADFYDPPTVERILRDLIAELREQRDIWLEPGMDPADDATFQVVASQVTALTDRAESRLKEVQDA